MKRRDAFTLTELLVLIATGTLAGAVLLASLGDAKEKIQAAACMSNMREINSAMNIAFFDGSVRNMTFAQAKATFTKSLWEGR